MRWRFAFLRLCLGLWAGLPYAGVRAAEAPPFTAGIETALVDAHLLASEYAGAQVVRVVGDSMVPFFRDGAILVVRPTAVESLRPGAVVVYVNRFGETIAHRVLKAVGTGWQVRGYHNRAPDSTIVNAENVRGVVYATFFAHRTGEPTDPVRLATLLLSTPVVLAAPAR